jgi:hypothetical protein
MTHVAGILPFSREGQRDRDLIGLNAGKASALVAFGGGSMDSHPAPWFCIPLHTTPSTSLPWDPSTLMRVIAWRGRLGSLGGRHRTSSSPWSLGVGSKRKKRRSRRRDRRRRVPGLPFYSLSRCTASGSRPFDQPSTDKRGPREPTKCPFNPHNMP